MALHFFFPFNNFDTFAICFFSFRFKPRRKCKPKVAHFCYTDKKENKTILLMESGAKSYEEGLRKTRGNAHIFSPFMRRLLVIYDFAPDPSEFPNV
jgi:hypothetical protein